MYINKGRILGNVKVKVTCYCGDFKGATGNLQEKLYLKYLFSTCKVSETHLTHVAIETIWKHRNVKGMSLGESQI